MRDFPKRDLKGLSQGLSDRVGPQADRIGLIVLVEQVTDPGRPQFADPSNGDADAGGATLSSPASRDFGEDPGFERVIGGRDPLL